MGFHLLKQNIRRNLKDNIGDEEDSERNIILHSRFDIQVFFETQECGITNIDSAMS